jgi:Raf kinase inhibitor-like YbhB/YbcL family protein/uncharacterized protein (TIGR00297 family)
MNLSLLQLPLGIILAAIIAVAAYLVKSLSRSGAIAAFVLGSVIFGIGGISWSILLLAFFISSSGLSKLFKKRKLALDEKFSKGSRRDAGQVAANGAIAGILTILFPLFGGSSWIWAAFAGALAAVNADTWATELGVLSKSSPRLITTGMTVEPGTSGGISLAGTLAALGGSMFIAIPAVLFQPAGFSLNNWQNLLLFLIITFSGLAGSMIDSFLGATIQAIYFCSNCQKQTEKHPLHSCGNPTRLIRGNAWLNNDWVNTFCSFSGAILAGIIGIILLSSPSIPSTIQGGKDMAKITISSPAFAQGQPIPVKYTCSGENKSPELIWSEIPHTTRSIALILDDPDAPMGTFTHWVVYNLPPESKGLPENTPAGKVPGGGSQGFNSGKKDGYIGPCPPAGKPHRYFFKIYATDLEPNLPEGLTVDNLTSQLAGHTLATGEWMGTFQR